MALLTAAVHDTERGRSAGGGDEAKAVWFSGGAKEIRNPNPEIRKKHASQATM
jgi:hypothetical protein